MKVAIIDAYHALHFELIKSLIDSNIDISYAITGAHENFHGDKSLIKKLINQWPDHLKVESINDFLFSHKIIELIQSEEFVLSNNVLEQYSEEEVIFYKLSDRSTVIPTSVHRRSKYYQILLNHFINIYQKHQFTHVLCFDTPHSFFSNLFYRVLLKNNVKPLRIEYHYFSDYCLLLDAPEIPLIPDNYNTPLSITELSKKVPVTLLNKLKSPNSFVQSYVNKEKKATISNSWFSPVQITTRHIIKYTGNIILGFAPFLHRKEIRHFTSLIGLKRGIGELTYRITINKALRRNLTIQLYYNKISTPPKFATPYVFFAMHMQPEKTSLPLGRRMDNHLTAITILSQSLPSGWKLYVKEHPNQFNVRKVTNQNFRSKLFYDAILSLTNVCLLPLDTPTDQLIKESQLVSTLTGTVGWEALEQGKPVLVFGEAYYKACKAVRLINDVSSCKNAISDLKDTTQDEVLKELYRYLAYYSEKGILINAANWESKVAHSDVSRSKQVETLSEAIRRRLTS